MKSAIVTGLRGQDGSYLAEQLITEGYRVYGIIRRASTGLDLGCASGLQDNPMLEVTEGDILDGGGLARLCGLVKPDLFFNMAAQSHVGTSFSQPTYTSQVDGIGVLNCLEAIRLSGAHTRFLQASTSELYGGISGGATNEKTSFYPRSPYGCAKLFGYWITVNYRESYKMFACNSICHNHESERRGPNFVTRKITQAAARISLGLQSKLYLGNLDAKRDWGYAPDFTRGMIMMLIKASQPKDYVLATGETHSVKEFCKIAFKHVGLQWSDYVEIDPQFYRPAEVNVLLGDYSEINKDLGWEPWTKFNELVIRMVDNDLSLLSPNK
jgi:GDPmannose 4,6-dehydratase